MDDERQRTLDDRAARLPEHERDDDVAATMGGGVLAQGGTAVDRGTGDLTGTAQPAPDEEAVTEDPPVDDVVALPGPRPEAPAIALDSDPDDPAADPNR